MKTKMKKLFFLSILILILCAPVMGQSFGLDKTWAPIWQTWRFDSLETDNDSALVIFYLPVPVYVKSLSVVSSTADSSYFRLVEYTGDGADEITALDSVKSNAGSYATYYNNMGVLLPVGLYRINFIHSHTGGASSVEMRDVHLSLWGQLIYGAGYWGMKEEEFFLSYPKEEPK